MEHKQKYEMVQPLKDSHYLSFLEPMSDPCVGLEYFFYGLEIMQKA